MPLRDHFKSDLPPSQSWEPLHGLWPATIAQRLAPFLPPGYVAVPKTHAGTSIEVDVAAFETRGASPAVVAGIGPHLTAWQPEAPTLAFETELLDIDDYSVHVYDVRVYEKLVAAIELVSPANKDRPAHRVAFVGKCAALIRQGVSVALVDVVTNRRISLYAQLLRLLGLEDTVRGAAPLYAAELRRPDCETHSTRLEIWARELQVGAPLPTLPLWLGEDFAVPLELEASYSDACQVMRMP